MEKCSKLIFFQLFFLEIKRTVFAYHRVVLNCILRNARGEAVEAGDVECKWKDPDGNFLVYQSPHSKVPSIKMISFPKKHKNRTEPSSPSEEENEVSDNNTYNNSSNSNSSSSSSNNSTTLIRNEEASPEEEMDSCKLPLEVESDETTGGHESKNIFS